MGNLDEVRKLRIQVHQYFMLPEEMWLEWVKDEIMCEGAGEAAGGVNPYDLFQMAFADYQYENLSYKFLKYIVRKAND